jgi:hypothetical protein
MSAPRDQKTHELWQHDLDSLNVNIPRIESQVRLWERTADNLQDIDPVLAQDYRDFAEYTQMRADRAKKRKQRILDYLSGKIGPWW